MIDGFTIVEIGMIILLSTTVIAFLLMLATKKENLGFGILFGGLTLGILLFLVGVINMEKEDQIKNELEKQKIDSLSCQALGEYLLNNAGNFTYSDGSIKNHNYQYVEAKFLLCTHSLISRLSP